MSPSSLPEVVRVVWTGKAAPEKTRLRSHFTVRKQKVYDALEWLCGHHEDYRQVTIDKERLSAWESTFVATELLESIAHVADPTDNVLYQPPSYMLVKLLHDFHLSLTAFSNPHQDGEVHAQQGSWQECHT